MLQEQHRRGVACRARERPEALELRVPGTDARVGECPHGFAPNVCLQVSVSILFVGYVLMQVPSNLWLNKMGKPALYLPTCVSGPFGRRHEVAAHPC